jgi:hypothetical protein
MTNRKYTDCKEKAKKARRGLDVDRRTISKSETD